MLSLLPTRLSVVPAIYSSPSKIRVRICIPLYPKPTISVNHQSQKMNISTEATSQSSDTTDNVGKSEDVIVQYVVLRRDIIDSWPLGSVVTQGCHASVSAIWAHKDDAYTIDYCSPEKIESMHKVTLEVKGETQLRNMSIKLTENDVAHKLWIEQPENIPTCLATKPYPKSAVSSIFRKLKLCK